MDDPGQDVTSRFVGSKGMRHRRSLQPGRDVLLDGNILIVIEQIRTEHEKEIDREYGQPRHGALVPLQTFPRVIGLTSWFLSYRRRHSV